jgi:hypothetical protein
MTGVEAKHLITVIMAPVGLLALILEIWHDRGRQAGRTVYRAPDAWVNVLLGTSAMAMEAALYGLFVGASCDISAADPGGL